MQVVIATLSPIFINMIGGVFLIVSSNRKYVNRGFLSLFMFNSSLLFVGHFLYFQKYVAFYQYYDFIFLFSLLAFFPLYYVYVKSVFDFQIKLKSYLLHFLPSVIVSIAILTLSLTINRSDFAAYFYKMMDGATKTNQLSEGLFFTYQFGRGLHVIQIIVYSTVIIRYIISNINRLKNYFSNMDEIQPQYFVIINGLFLFFMISSGFATTLSGRGAFAGSPAILCVSGLVFSLMHLMICLHGVKQIPVNAQFPKENGNGSVAILDFSNSEEIEQRLIKHFENQHPWLKPDLKIWDIVVAVGTNRTYLSRVINERLHSNFNDFVNSYRFKEAESIIKSDTKQDLPLKAIAQMSGFGSDTSFVRTFKKHSGLTPSEFRRTIL